MGWGKFACLAYGSHTDRLYVQAPLDKDKIGISVQVASEYLQVCLL